MGDLKHVLVRWVKGKEFETTTESGHHVITDASLQYGGTNHGPSPMELLLGCLGSCTGISVVDILLKKRQAVTAFEMQVEGRIADTYPKVYSDLEVIYFVHGKNISPKAVDEAIALSREKYCSISEMLAKSAKLTMRYEIVEEADSPQNPNA